MFLSSVNSSKSFQVGMWAIQLKVVLNLQGLVQLLNSLNFVEGH